MILLHKFESVFRDRPVERNSLAIPSQLENNAGYPSTHDGSNAELQQRDADEMLMRQLIFGRLKVISDMKTESLFQRASGQAPRRS